MIDPIPTSHDARDAIERIVGQAHIRDAAADDAIDGVRPRWVAAPGSANEVAGVLRVANESDLCIIPRGSGTKLDWGNPPTRADLVLCTQRLDRVLEHAFGDMTATVQAGCTVAAFNQHLAAHGQRLAVDPVWPAQATIGGILATNDSGALRATVGPLRDHLIGITVVLADGTIAKSGGKVVKNVAGFDLPKLFTGSFGTLGVIVEATFRLYACPKACRWIKLGVPDSERLGNTLAAINAISALTSSVQIKASGDDPTSIVIGVEGLVDAIDGKVQRIVKAALDVGAQDGHISSSSPSPGTPGEGWGEGLVGHPRESPHPNPLPAYREREPEISAACRERLFRKVDACVSKISLLPTQWPEFLEMLRKFAATADLRWEIAGQAMGVGLLALSGSDSGRMSDSLVAIREHLERSQGSLVLLRSPAGVKNAIGAWPKPDGAFPLMRRIKEQFDPNMILSPGRFVGGI